MKLACCLLKNVEDAYQAALIIPLRNSQKQKLRSRGINPIKDKG